MPNAPTTLPVRLFRFMISAFTVLVSVGYAQEAAALTDVTAGALISTTDTQGIAWGSFRHVSERGLPDLFVVGDGSSRLLRNDAGFTFVDVTPPALAGGPGGASATWVDFNNDGYADLFVVNSITGARLWRNDSQLGSSTPAFTDVTPTALGVPGLGSVAAAWGDYDGDGDLDVYLVHAGADNQLFRNDTPRLGATPVFTEVTAQSAVLGLPGRSHAHASWVDIDGDGDLDLHAGNADFGDVIFRNDAGTFVQLSLPVLEASRSATWGDFDHDGDLDLFSTSPTNPDRLYRNDGNFSFTEVGGYAGGPGQTIRPVNVLATSQWANGNDGKAIHLIDGTGLLGGGAVIDQTHDASMNSTTMWHAGDADGGLGGPTGTPPNVDAQALVFDLGAHYDLTGADIWNFNAQGLASRGVADFEILVSSDTDPLTASFSSVGTFSLSAAAGVSGAPAQFKAFTASNVRLVKFDINTAQSGLLDDYVGLSEVRFRRAPATGVSAVWSDADNDGDLDLVVVLDSGTDLLFTNDGSGQFTASDLPAEPAAGSACGWADANGDGSLDLYLGGTGTNSDRLLSGASGGHWIEIQPRGTNSNPDGLGAFVTLYSPLGARVLHTTNGDGARSAALADRAHFGLGASTTVDSVRVYWPASGVSRVVRASGLTVDAVNAVQESAFEFIASDDQYENRVSLKWTGAGGSGYLYKLYRRLPGAAPPGQLLTYLSSADSTYQDASGNAGTQYLYTLQKFSLPNLNLELEASDLGRRIVFAPDNVSASDGTFSDRIRVLWADRSQIEAGYKVELPAFSPWGTGQVRFPPLPPASVVVGALEGDSVVVFEEQSDIVLGSDLLVDNVAAGALSGSSGIPGTIPGLTEVSSYFIHADPAGSPSGQVFEARITFDSEVLGLIYESSRLDASDALLGAPGTLYPFGEGQRGITGPDKFTLSADRRTLDIHFSLNGSADQMRVITRGGARIASLGANEGVYDDVNAPPGPFLGYTVHAVDPAGAGSDTIAVTGRRAFFLPAGGVQASDGTWSDRVRVTWAPPADSAAGARNPDKSSYVIWRRNTGPGTWTFAPIDSVRRLSVSQYDDMTDLGATYEYGVTVVAVDDDLNVLGESLLEIDDATDTGIGGPATMEPVTNVAATDSTLDDQVAVTWNDHPLEDFYILTRNGLPVDTVGAGVTLFSDVTATPAVRYDYGVIAATNHGGTSAAASDSGTRSTIIAVKNLQASDGTSESKVDITWESGSTTAALFKIFRDGAPIQTAPGSARAISDEDVDTEVHTYTVIGVTPDGQEAGPVMDTGFRKIAAPTLVNASDNAYEDIVRITWQDNSAVEDGYRVLRREVGSVAVPDTLGQTARNAQAYSDTSAVSGLAYTYTVHAFDHLGGLSAGASENGRRTLHAPTSVSASDGSDEDRIRITWTDASQRENGYRIYRKTSGSQDTPDLIGEVLPNATSFVDSGATEPIVFADPYTYSVVAYDAYGESPPGADDGSTGILPVESLNASTTYDYGIVLVWTDRSRVETGYRIERDGVPLANLPANAASYVDSLPGAGQHEYCVIAVSGSWSSPNRCAIGQQFVAVETPVVGLEPTDQWTDNNSGFGASAAVSSNGRAMVGSYMANIPFRTEGTGPGYSDYEDRVWTNATGAVVTYENLGSGWVQTGTIYPDTLLLANQDLTPRFFGYSVAMNREGTIAVVGAPGSFLGPQDRTKWGEYNGTNADYYNKPGTFSTSTYGQVGLAFVYEYGANGWEFKQLLIGEYDQPGATPYPGWGTRETFGYAVDVQDDRIIVSRPFRDENTVDVANRPSVHIYERDNTGSWVPVKKFQGTSPLATTGTTTFQTLTDTYGAAVAIDGDIAVWGGWGQDVAYATPGPYDSVYVSIRDSVSGLWSDPVSYGAPGYDTGACVDVDAKRGVIVFSDWGYALGVTGHVYELRRRADGTWAGPTAIAGLPMGNAVHLALDGDLLLIGWNDQPTHVGDGEDLGRVYIYEFDGNAWVPTGLATATGDDTPGQAPWNSHDLLGRALALSGDYVFMGAPANNGYEGINTNYPDLDELVLPLRAPTNMPGGVNYVSAYSAANPGRVYAMGVPRHPIDLDAGDGARTGPISLKWTPISRNEDGFLIHRDGAVVDRVSAGTRSYVDNDAASGRTYEYQVTAIGADGFSRQPGAHDRGRSLPNGEISGRVATPLGGGVAGVQVTTSPSPNASLLLDGEAAYAVTDAGPGLPAQFTLEFWVRPSDLSTSASLISKSTIFAGGPSSVFALTTTASDLGPVNDDLLLSGFSPQGGGTITLDQALVVGEWRHVSVRMASGNWNLSVYDPATGVTQTQTSSGGMLYDWSGNVAPDAPLSFGARLIPSDPYPADGSVTGYFSGNLDDIRIWDSLLSDSLIAARRTSVLTGSELGLIAYWPLDQRTGVYGDELAANRYLKLERGAYWSQESAPLRIFAVTDVEGNYALSGLRYGDAASLEVTPYKDPGQFEPEYRTITLSAGSPVWNQVDFNEVTSFTLSGLVEFDSLSCPVEGVEVLVDGTVAATTDNAGRFSTALRPGTHEVSVRKSGLTFTASQTIDMTGDVSGLHFDALTRRFVTVKLGGGCSGDLVGTYHLKIESSEGCYSRSIQAAFDTELSLAPMAYRITVEDVTSVPATLDRAALLQYFDTRGPQDFDLTNADTTVDLRYQAPLEMRITGLFGGGATAVQYPGGTAAPPDGIIDQTERVRLRFEVFSTYADGTTCSPDSGMITIYDEVMDRTDPVQIPIHGGIAEYETAGNTPNIFVGRVDAEGRDRSYQKPITAVAVADGGIAQKTAWVLVTGHRPRAASFVATTQEIPILILRDPPGDNSYAYLEKDQKFCTSLSRMKFKSRSDTYSAGLRLGAEFSAGEIYSVPYSFTAANIQATLEMASQTTESSAIDICAETNQRFATSANEGFIGEDGDVFLSAGLNFTFAKTDVVEARRVGTILEVLPSTSVAMAPSGFESLLFFTRGHILNEEIPRLTALAEYFDAQANPGQAAFYRSAVANWRRHVALADSLKKSALFVQNRSFSAGADFEYTATSDTSETVSYEAKAFTNNSVSIGTGFQIAGNGANLNYEVETTMELGQDRSRSSSSQRSVGYVLSDNDRGDYFSVDVKSDPKYGTPVFDLKSGTSSCPWEAPTQKRDLPLLTITNTGTDVWPADQPAQFILNLTNNSESEEDRKYLIVADQVTNPDGAVIKVNGVTLGNDGVEFLVPRFDSNHNPGTSRATLTVERGPARYTYKGLRLRMIPPCELEAFDNGFPTTLWSDAVIPDVRFDGPCSDVAVAIPSEGWVHNRADSIQSVMDYGADYVGVLLTGFELHPQENKELTEIGAEYRRVGTDTWYSIGHVDLTQTPVNEGDPIALNWDVTDFPGEPGVEDGTYEIRAYTRCRNTDTGVLSAPYRTPPVRGVIDRAGPRVLATNPADAVLSLGESITADFSEPIDGSELVVNCPSDDSTCTDNVSLFRDPNGDNEKMAIDVFTEGSRLTVIPQNLRALAGETVQVRLNGIPDIAGNVADSLHLSADDTIWEFNVTQNTFAWTKASDSLTTTIGAPAARKLVLANGTASSVNFDVSLDLSGPAALPLQGLIAADVVSGTMAPGSTKDIRITLLNSAPAGTYTVPVLALGNGGSYASSLTLTVVVSCDPPQWTVTPSDFEHSMTMVGQVRVEGATSFDPNDLVAAFVGDQIRGVAHATATGLAYLTIYSNNQSGERIRFRIWDDDACRLYTYAEVNDPATAEATDALFFEKNGVRGSVAAPVTLDARDPVFIATTEIPVAAGWTWISLNRSTALGLTTSLVLGDLSLTEGDLIKTFGTTSNPNAFATFSPICGWGCDPNGLDTLDVVHGYMVKLAEAGTIVLEGNPVDPSAASSRIMLTPGWNLIGYPGTSPSTVSDAFGNPAAPLHPKDGTLVKSQYAFAQYDSVLSDWFGDLTMQPGQGYMLWSAAADSFYYPPLIAGAAAPIASLTGSVDGGSVRGPARGSAPLGSLQPVAKRTDSEEAVLLSRRTLPGVRSAEGPGWTFDPGAFQYNMTLTASIDIGGEPPREDQLVAAVVNGEIRGWARPQLVSGLGEYRLFLMIYSNTGSGEQVAFQVYDPATDSVLPVSEHLTFKADDALGQVSVPFQLNAQDGSGDATIRAAALRWVGPNPVKSSEALRVSFELPVRSAVDMEMFDLRGRRVAGSKGRMFEAGRHVMNFRGPDLPPGIYLFRIQMGSKSFVRKVAVYAAGSQP